MIHSSLTKLVVILLLIFSLCTKNTFAEHQSPQDSIRKILPSLSGGNRLQALADIVSLVAMGNDIDRLAEMTDAFSIPGEKVKKLAWLIKPIGKLLNKLTYKKIWRLCKKESGLKKADIADIADNKVVDFLLELVQNLYCGDSPYGPETKEYKII